MQIHADENNLQILVWRASKWWPQCKQAHLKKNIEYLELLEITGKLWTCLFLCTQWQLQQGRTQSIEAKITGAGFLAKPYVGIEENWQHTVMLNTRPPWETFSINLALIARLFELACSRMDHPCHKNHASLGENKTEIVQPLFVQSNTLLKIWASTSCRFIIGQCFLIFEKVSVKGILCIPASLSRKQKKKKKVLHEAITSADT
jgi:hypothetical protein